MASSNTHAAQLADFIEQIGAAMHRAGVAHVELTEGPVKVLTLAPTLPPGLLGGDDAPKDETPEERAAREEQTLFASAEGR